MVFIPETGQGFHADAVARGIGRWQAVFVECDRAIEAVLYENVQHIFLTDDEKSQAFSMRLEKTMDRSVLNAGLQSGISA